MLTKVRLLTVVVVFAMLAAGCVLPAVPASAPAASEEPALPTPQPGLVTAENVRARPAPLEGGTAAAYMLLLNGTDAPVTLQAAKSEIAGAVELHETVTEDGIMKMVPRLEGFEIPAGGVVELKPGGKHVMFIGLLAPLEVGDEFALTLDLSDGTSLSLTVPVVEMAMPESMPDMGHDGMEGMEDMEDMDSHDMGGDDTEGDD